VTEVLLVPMTEQHIPEVLRHEPELFGPEAWSAASYRSELADRRHRHYIAATGADGEFLGWAGLMTIGPTAQVLTIGVITSAQRQGIGQRLLDALTEQARLRGAQEILLEVRVGNDPAIGLYQRNGFVGFRVRHGYYDLGRADALEMRREL
jgi:ribosomal-protein-alanine N-acetyltransferase